MKDVKAHFIFRDDRKIIKSIEKDKRIIASVPSFDSAGHIRMFKNKKEIINRYKDLIKINRIEEHVMNNQNDIIWILFGVRK